MSGCEFWDFHSGLLAVLPRLLIIHSLYFCARSRRPNTIHNVHWIRSRYETHQLTLLTLECITWWRQHFSSLSSLSMRKRMFHFSFILICFFSPLISRSNFPVYPRFGHCFPSTVCGLTGIYIHGWQLKLSVKSKNNIIQYDSHSTNIL